MDLPETETNDKARSVFYCPLSPDYTWDLNNTTFSWILVIVRYIASPAAIFLNILVIAVLNKRKVMKKTSTILMTSLAVADLLGGGISMPLSATIDVLILRQVSFEHICFLVNGPDVCAMYFVFFSSLYHLAAIAWERYVAVVKWMDYKVIVTTNRLKKLAIIAWIGTVFTILSPLLPTVAGGDIEIIEYIFVAWMVCATIALIAIVYFYVMVYLAIRKRKISEISQVTTLVRAKLESKVAKTTFLLTAAVIVSNAPGIVFHFLGEAFPFLRTSVNFRVWELLIQLNSLVNPLLYCYRDRRFRNALLELLRIRKPRASQPAVYSVRYVRRKDQFAAEEDALDRQHVVRHTRLKRTLSCDLTVVSDCAHGRPRDIMLKRSMSAPMLKECCSVSSIDELELRQPSSIIVTTATINVQTGQRDKMKKTIPKLPKDVNLTQAMPNCVCDTSRSKSAKSCPDIEETILKRPRTAP